ncbi:hypothetical protein [Oenococcus sicerae]|uniref:hypothetical protein n=1 Tax=Oenococcus sicerae TaxID=2203724 RepID=UPI0039E73A13
MNFEEIMVQALANNKNRLQDMKSRALMDHKQAELMAFALNDPSKMPTAEESYPFLKEQPKAAETIPDWKKDQLLLMQQSQRVKQVNKLKK